MKGLLALFLALVMVAPTAALSLSCDCDESQVTSECPCCVQQQTQASGDDIAKAPVCNCGSQVLFASAVETPQAFYHGLVESVVTEETQALRSARHPLVTISSGWLRIQQTTVLLV